MDDSGKPSLSAGVENHLEVGWVIDKTPPLTSVRQLGRNESSEGLKQGSGQWNSDAAVLARAECEEMPSDEPGSVAWVLGPSITSVLLQYQQFTLFSSSCLIAVLLLREALLTVSLTVPHAVSHTEDLFLYFKTFIMIAHKM